jgi:predicted AAA+ superfamily ATPase
MAKGSVARDIEPELARRTRGSPVVVLTGPRQSGKTTLVRKLFSRLPYRNLEAPDVRERALSDPRGFLQSLPGGAVLDEIQRAPDLLSYIQVDVDERPRPGRYILTGSQNLLMLSGVAQSLAGRAALLELLPLSVTELERAGWLSETPFEVMFRGGYPAPFQRGEDTRDWLGDYVRTYVERDVRQVLAVGDLLAFQTFLRIAATRTGQLLNLSQLGADAGVSHNTAKSWLGILEASYVAIRIPPFFRNLGKRLVKTPKLHFIDTGLVCYLLGIRSARELEAHPLRGAVFESWVVSEACKVQRNTGLHAGMTFFRDAHGLEIDLLVERGADVLAIEAKSGQTLSSDAFAPLDALARLIPEKVDRVVVHGGRESWSARGGRAVGYRDVGSIDWGARPPAPKSERTPKRKRAQNAPRKGR